MSQPQIRVRSGDETSTATLEGGGTAAQVLEALGTRRGRVVAARVDDRLVDLEHPVHDDAVVEPVLADSDDGRGIIRHSTAHVLAQAVTGLFPGTKLADGPTTDSGFFYAFDVGRPFTPDDLEVIGARMRELVGEDQAFRRREVGVAEALAELTDEPYKREFVERAAAGAALEDPTAPDAEDGTVSFYDNVAADGTLVWTDLCRGPHLPSTRWIPAFELERVAGAYWRGDESQPRLQRVYGTAWESRKALAAYQERLAQARERDHRKLGRELDLLSFPEELGSGLAVWHPRGATVRKAMEDYARSQHLARGYEPVYTPHIGRSTLWETSGHLDYYAEGMYPPMELDRPGSGGEGVDYYPKPMNCPFHVLVYRSRTRSYRELPLRLFELGTVYRYERSGTLHGLLRARGFTQDDSHIFCTEEQVVDEAAAAVRFAVDLYADFGFTGGPSRVALSTRPPKAETVGTDEGWAHAEAALARALSVSGLEYVVDEGEGAFYGPKIDLQVTDAIGRAWQLTTVQVDFTLPERFGITYAAADGTERRPYMIHRALFGSLDRFFAILLEHYAGAFPLWLAPVQAVVIPIADRHGAYAGALAGRLREAGLRVEVDDADAQMGAKIRRHQLAQVPYMLVVGDDEQEGGTVAVRPRRGSQRRGVAVDELIEELRLEITNRGRSVQGGRMSGDRVGAPALHGERREDEQRLDQL